MTGRNRAGSLQSLVGPAQLRDLPAQPPVLLVHVCGRPVRTLAAIGLVLPDPVPHRLRMHAELLGETFDHRPRAARTPGTRLRAGGPVTDTIVVCGAFLVGEPDHPVLRGLPRTIHVPGTNGQPQDWVAPLVTALQAEAFDGGPGSDLVMARLSDALLLRALRHYSGTVDQPGWLAGLRDPHVAAALAAIHHDISHPWTLGGLARTAGLSRAAFAARFSKSVGVPAMRYLLSLRIQRAKTLLRNRHTTITAVATQVGYQSGVAFSAAFKRETGHPPGDYRQRPAVHIGTHPPAATGNHPE